MSGRTVTRAQLSEAVYQEVGLSRNESADLVESILDEVADHLIGGETVKVSSFGSFTCAKKASVLGAIPKPGRKFLFCRGVFWCFDRPMF